MANGQPQNGTVANGSTVNTNAGSAQTNQLQPLQAQQQVISKVFSLLMSSQTYKTIRHTTNFHIILAIWLGDVNASSTPLSRFLDAT